MASATLVKKEIESKLVWFGGVEVKGLAASMTEEQFINFSLLNPDLRIEQDKHGNIIIMSPVSLDSGNHESEVGIDLGLWNRKTKLGKTYSPSTLFILPDGEKRMADASWISKQKLKNLDWKARKSFAKIVPDFIVEVRSPSDAVIDLKNKIQKVWLKNGVKLAWLIDPIDGTHWVYHQGGAVQEVKGMHQKMSGEPVLPGFEFDLGIIKEDVG